MNDTDFTRILQLEEEYVEKVCSEIIALKPDVVFTEKGVSDLAQHYLVKVFKDTIFSWNSHKSNAYTDKRIQFLEITVQFTSVYAICFEMYELLFLVS